MALLALLFCCQWATGAVASDQLNSKSGGKTRLEERTGEACGQDGREGRPDQQTPQTPADSKWTPKTRDLVFKKIRVCCHVRTLCCFFHRPKNWPRVLRNTQVKSWVESNHLLRLLWRLNKRGRKVWPSTTIYSFSEKPRNSETAWNKMTSSGKHELQDCFTYRLWCYSWIKRNTLCGSSACFCFFLQMWSQMGPENKSNVWNGITF